MDSVDAAGSGFAPDDVLRRSLLAQYPERALQTALERYWVVRPDIEAGLPAERLSGPKRATRMNWLKAYRRAQRECGVGLVGLFAPSGTAPATGPSGSRPRPWC